VDRSPLLHVSPASAAFSAGLANCCYVSKSGSDTTGTRGSIAKPFLTIAAAMAASQSGDVIMLGPGRWVENVTLLENRSIVGSGSRATEINGTLAQTPGATSDNNFVTLAAFRLTGAATVTLTAKTGGDNLFSLNDLILEQTLTLTRATNGKKEVYLDGVIVGSTLTSNFGKISAFGCEIAALALTSGGGGEHWRFKGCSFVSVTITSAQGNSRFTGCTITTALTHSDAYIGDSLLWTVGCELIAAAITIHGGIWYEYGCTFDQSQIAGASGNKRVSSQIIAMQTYANGTTVVTLPVALGSTDYVVTVEYNSASGVHGCYVADKTGTGFKIINPNDAEELTLMVHYRKQ
jgi:hypothetical protein